MTLKMPQFDLPLKILLLGSPKDRQACRKALMLQNFEILEAETCEHGLKLSLENEFSCIILHDDAGFIESHFSQKPSSAAAIIVLITPQKEAPDMELLNRGTIEYIAATSISLGLLSPAVMNIIARASLKEELRRGRDAFSDFTHIVAHDLKSPLRNIAAYCSFLKEDCTDKLDEEGRKYIERLSANAVRLQQMIDDLCSDAMQSRYK